MTNICKNCSEVSTPNSDGKCPKCGSDKGYTVSKTLTVRYSIEDEKTQVKKAITEKINDYTEKIFKDQFPNVYKILKESLEKRKDNF
jgi:hypothetical protein